MKQKGLTLVELLVAMVIAGILGAGAYRTFVGQQHTYQVQDQVVDLQQNARMAINRMTRELRMGGFGRMDSNFFSATKHGSKMHGSYENNVTPGGDGKSVTIVAALPIVTRLTANTDSTNIITVADASGFDLDKKSYISINGMESDRIHGIDGKEIRLKEGTKLVYGHSAGEPVYLVMAITYSIGMLDGKSVLLRDDHLGLGPQPVAENIEDLRFRYVMNTGETLDVVPNNRLDDIRMLQTTIVATSDRAKPDPELAKVGDGLRRRTLTTNIQFRNLLFP